MSKTVTVLPDADEPPAGAGDLYEVVNGRVVEPPPMGVFESLISNKLHTAVMLHFGTAGLHEHTGVELLFQLRAKPVLQRRPDLAFVSYERWPKDRRLPETAAWEVVPNLAVEVISPTDRAVKVLRKIDDYFQAGVQQVWVVFPRDGRLFLHSGPTSITVLDASDTLDGGAIFPGFRIKLADLFDETAGLAS